MLSAAEIVWQQVRLALFDAGVEIARGMQRPCHSWSIVSNSESPLSIEENDSAMPVQSVLQVVHRFCRDPLG